MEGGRRRRQAGRQDKDKGKEMTSTRACVCMRVCMCVEVEADEVIRRVRQGKGRRIKDH